MQFDEDAIRLVAQEFKVPFTETKRLLHLMILGGYGGRRAAKAVWDTSIKKDKALRMKKRYLELAKTPPPQVKADEELARLKNQHNNIEQRAAEEEAAKNLADEKDRLRKENLIGEVKLGGTKLILETLKGDPPLHKRFIAYYELKGLTPERALNLLGCTTTNLLGEICYYIEPWQQALLDSIKYVLDKYDEELPSMHTLETRLYMRDHFPSRCPKCRRSIRYISGHTLKGKQGFYIGCPSTRHYFMWMVKCPLCGSFMMVKTIMRWDVLKSLICPKCKEIWRKEEYQKWPTKYIVRVAPQGPEEAEEVKKEKREELSPRPRKQWRNFLRFNPDDIIAEINRPVLEDIIDQRMIFYIRELTAAGATEIIFKEAAKKLGIRPTQVFYSWKRLRDKGLL